MRNIIAILLIICIQSHISGQEFHHLEGKVFQKSTAIPIPYCNMKLIKGNVTTYSNTEGVFVLNMPYDQSDTLLITSVGYNKLEIPLSKLQANGENHIYLQEHVSILDEVVITPVKITSILNDAIKVSNAAYPSHSILTGYYKEYVKRDSFLTKYADGIVSYYIEKQKKGLPKITLSVDASRVKEIVLPDDDEKMDQLNSPIDIVKIGEYASPVKVIGLDNSRFDLYRFTLVEVENNGRQTYIISFEPKMGGANTLFAGRIYVDKETQLIIGIDYAVAPISAMFQKSVSILGIRVSSTSRSVSARYKIAGQDYYLTYVGVNFGMNIHSRRYNQDNDFKSEFWVTAFKTGEISLPAKNLYSKKSLYKRGNQYTTAFWNDYKFTSNSKAEINFLK